MHVIQPSSVHNEIYGLIGYPLEHSFSPDYFKAKFDRENLANYSYRLFPLKAITDFPDLVKSHPQLAGLNVTVPYKESIIPYLHAMDAIAQKVRAVNTIKINPENGKMTGFNTDITGFENSLRPLLRHHHRKALILGTGGAAKAVRYVLNKLNIEYLSVSRTPEKDEIHYDNIKNYIDTHLLIINTTPLGMYPVENKAPALPYELLTSRHLLYDLVYRPETTLFLQQGKARGTTVKNGLEMLYLQAEKSWEIWNAPGQ